MHSHAAKVALALTNDYGNSIQIIINHIRVQVLCKLCLFYNYLSPHVYFIYYRSTESGMDSLCTIAMDKRKIAEAEILKQWMIDITQRDPGKCGVLMCFFNGSFNPT